MLVSNGFQRDWIKKKLTDIGFFDPDNYRDGLSLGSDQNLMDYWFSSDIGLIDKVSINFWYKHKSAPMSAQETNYCIFDFRDLPCQ